MSSNKRKSSDSKNKAGTGASTEPMVMVPLSFMATQPAAFRQVAAPNGGTFYVTPNQCRAQGSGSKKPSTSQPRKKAWLDDYVDDDDDDDDGDCSGRDEDTPPKKKRLSLPRGKPSTSNQKPGGHSSMSAHAQIAARKVRALPDKFMGRPIISQQNKTDCVSCGMYLGEVMLLPCGHCSFCTKCINKLHDRSHQLKRLQNCPVEACLQSVESWVRLRNIMV